VIVEPDTPFELLPPPLLEQPVAISAKEAAATTAADSLVRRENFTVTPLCAWIGAIFEDVHVSWERSHKIELTLSIGHCESQELFGSAPKNP
jgi:hypothetical protein